MKTAIRAFAMSIALAGLLTSTSAAPRNLSANQSAFMAGPGPLSLPAPGCGPGVPTCTQFVGL
jgi:hypothetical protein